MKPILNGFVTIGEVKAGSTITSYKGLTLIVHPDEPVKFINMATQSIEELPMERREDFETFVFMSGQQWTADELARTQRT